MKKIGLIMLTLGLFATAKAQHCGWCGSHMIILDVRDDLTNKIIADLDIILTDSSGKPYISQWNLVSGYHYSMYQKSDTLKFGQNKKTKGKNNIIDFFPFGTDAYMLMVYGNNYPNIMKEGNDHIFIEDKQGRYESMSISFDRQQIAPMCTSSGLWSDDKIIERVAIKVRLKKKK